MRQSDAGGCLRRQHFIRKRALVLCYQVEGMPCCLVASAFMAQNQHKRKKGRESERRFTCTSCTWELIYPYTVLHTALLINSTHVSEIREPVVLLMLMDFISYHPWSWDMMAGSHRNWHLSTSGRPQVPQICYIKIVMYR